MIIDDEVTEKSDEEIKKEVAALRDVKEQIIRYTAFGDDNWQVIDAQIWVLENKVSLNRLYDKYDDDEYLIGPVIDAYNWKLGIRFAPKSLVADWQDLVVREK